MYKDVQDLIAAVKKIIPHYKIYGNSEYSDLIEDALEKLDESYSREKSLVIAKFRDVVSRPFYAEAGQEAIVAFAKYWLSLEKGAEKVFKETS